MKPTLDHLTVIAPSLPEGAAHVRDCLGVECPFGRKHGPMGTHNLVLRLGETVYLEVVAIDEAAPRPPHARWFGLDDRAAVRRAWDQGHRLRGWVAHTDDIDAEAARHASVYGAAKVLQGSAGRFVFTMPADGGLPMGGLAPSLIDRRGKPVSLPAAADLGCRLQAFRLQHPDADMVTDLYRRLKIVGAPTVEPGQSPQYLADIATPTGIRTLS